MLIKIATAVLIALGPGQPHLLAQAQSQLAVTTPEQKVHLLFTLDGESKRELQQSLSACKSVEVRYIAELHKRRMLWPDLRFARTMVRNRALCDEKSGARALQRTVDGSIVASSSGMSDAAVLAFMSETGNISAFQDVKFRNDSYSVRVKAMLVTAPDRLLQTGVLAETRFEIR